MTTRPTLCCRVRPDLRRGYAHPFLIACRVVLADVPVAPLAPFAIGESSHRLPHAPPPPAGSGRFVCRTTGWIAGAWRKVEVRRYEQDLRLHVADVGEFAVAPEGFAVVEAETPQVASSVLTETLLGPPLILALALQDVWCLHASAATVDGRGIAFAGESGNGKSTLAEFLDAAGDPRGGRFADDSLPISMGPEGILALPHFPQHKLPAAAQYPIDAPDRVPLAAVCVIAPPDTDVSVSLRRLGERQAMQALIRHTVAARLFDRPLLAAHLRFCERATARVPVWRLAYPHRREILPQVRDAVRHVLSLQPAENRSVTVVAGA